MGERAQHGQDEDPSDQDEAADETGQDQSHRILVRPHLFVLWEGIDNIIKDIYYEEISMINMLVCLTYMLI